MLRREEKLGLPVQYEFHRLGCVLSHAQLLSRDPMDCRPPGSSVHGISQQGCWSGLPFPSPGDLPDAGIEPKSPASPALQAGSLLLSYREGP